MPATTPPQPTVFCLAEDLAALAEAAETKSERTRLRLLAEAAAMLDEMPFPQLRPADLAERAGLSRALLYHYFTDLVALVTELVEEFERRIRAAAQTTRPLPPRAAYGEVVNYLAWVLAVALRNRGVMRLLHTRDVHLPGVKAVFDRVDFLMYEGVGDAIDPPPVLPFGRGERLMMGYLLAGGFDTLMRELFVAPNERLPRMRSAEELFALVQLVAVMRFRLLHGADPDAKDVRAVARRFDRSLFERCLQPRRKTAARERPASMQRLRRMAAKADE